MEKIIKPILAVICLAAFASGVSSCKKDAGEIDKSRECVVSFVTKLNPGQPGDTIRIQVLPGEFIRETPVPQKTGYYLEGWYTDAAVSNTGKGATPRIPAYDLVHKPIYLDVILHARWLPVE